MSLIETNSLKWINIYDNINYIGGIAYVKKGFLAQIHSHEEVEDYYFIFGIGKLYINGEVSIIKSPTKIKIGSNIKHAMTPITDYVVIYYSFSKGPFKSIKYHYYEAKL